MRDEIVGDPEQSGRSSVKLNPLYLSIDVQASLDKTSIDERLVLIGRYMKASYLPCFYILAIMIESSILLSDFARTTIAGILIVWINNFIAKALLFYISWKFVRKCALVYDVFLAKQQGTIYPTQPTEDVQTWQQEHNKKYERHWQVLLFVFLFNSMCSLVVTVVFQTKNGWGKAHSEHVNDTK